MLLVVWIVSILLFYAISVFAQEITVEEQPASSVMELTVPLWAQRTVFGYNGSIADTLELVPGSKTDSTVAYWAFKNMGMIVTVSGDSGKVKILAKGGKAPYFNGTAFDSLTIGAAGTYYWDIATPPDYAGQVLFLGVPQAVSGATVRVVGVIVRKRY